MVGHKLDLGEPEIAARLREVHVIADLDLQHLLADLVDHLFRAQRFPDDYIQNGLLAAASRYHRAALLRR